MAIIEWLGATTAPPGDWDGLLGGKGASLERLLRMEAPTPPGFCLTTRAFRHHLETGPRSREIAAAITALPDIDARAILDRHLTEEPLAPPIGDDLEHSVLRLARENGGESARFAVRSSAIGEDGRTASFAGIHETELELTTREVRAAVRRCWASLWSERALQYRQVRQLPVGGSMAVVVQVLVPADAAAVVFTRHPVTQRGDQLLVNAVRGLGESLVSGTVTPDEIVLDKASLALASMTRGDGIGPAPGSSVLTDSQLHDLATLSLHLEEQFGRPIDIEAALAGERWFILQARPITA
jgi:phosphoenolpyruvate synthase/pyruvate phosphate dikinase